MRDNDLFLIGLTDFITICLTFFSNSKINMRSRCELISSSPSVSFLQRKLSVGSNSGAETTLDASTTETDKVGKKKKKKRKKDDEAADAVDTTLGTTVEQVEEETDKKEKKKKKKKDKDKEKNADDE